MDRGALVSAALVLVGVFLVVTAPSDPQYSVSVYGPTDSSESEPVVAFENMSAEYRELFRETFEDGKRFAEPPGIRERYVAYEGEVYRMSSSAHDGSVFSLLMPPVGGLLVLTGCLGGGYRYYRSRRRE